MKKLILIKTIHTLVWIFFNIVLAYLFYAAITGRLDIGVWIGLGFFALEGIVLLVFKWTCPLTVLARRYSDSQQDNFDIFLPNWLARYTKLIYTTLLAIVIMLLAYRLLFTK
ncbi:MAG: hypothetical protein ABW019_07275 [Chitinophagaceae bacterium]